MSANNTSTPQLWAARILTGIAVAFLLLDAAMKVLQLPPAIEGTIALGFPASAVLGIGLLELACIALYVTPRTSILGAILLTGYLGGAIASQVRVGAPLLTHILFPTYIAGLYWTGLYLRDERLRVLVPIRTHA
ncbi:MAG: DoxX family protein [bacterium]